MNSCIFRFAIIITVAASVGGCIFQNEYECEDKSFGSGECSYVLEYFGSTDCDIPGCVEEERCTDYSAVDSTDSSTTDSESDSTTDTDSDTHPEGLVCESVCTGFVQSCYTYSKGSECEDVFYCEWVPVHYY